MILLVSGFEGLMLCRQDAARSATKGICGAHSMEEAEALCDRIGVLADGCLQCIANPARDEDESELRRRRSEEAEKI
uniref:Uncharacterized protein n=1 Tax=Vitis vinifera TaxID=29760 RepID=F6I438_VITVI